MSLKENVCRFFKDRDEEEDEDDDEKKIFLRK